MRHSIATARRVRDQHCDVDVLIGVAVGVVFALLHHPSATGFWSCCRVRCACLCAVRGLIVGQFSGRSNQQICAKWSGLHRGMNIHASARACDAIATLANALTQGTDLIQPFASLGRLAAAATRARNSSSVTGAEEASPRRCSSEATRSSDLNKAIEARIRHEGAHWARTSRSSRWVRCSSAASSVYCTCPSLY